MKFLKKWDRYVNRIFLSTHFVISVTLHFFSGFELMSGVTSFHTKRLSLVVLVGHICWQLVLSTFVYLGLFYCVLFWWFCMWPGKHIQSSDHQDCPSFYCPLSSLESSLCMWHSISHKCMGGLGPFLSLLHTHIASGQPGICGEFIKPYDCFISWKSQLNSQLVHQSIQMGPQSQSSKVAGSRCSLGRQGF